MFGLIKKMFIRLLTDLVNAPNHTKCVSLSSLTKHVSCKWKCKFDARKWNSNQKWNNDKCGYECKKHTCGKSYIWNPAICSCENGEYLASIIDNSVITFDEIIEETKTIPTNFNEKK